MTEITLVDKEPLRWSGEDTIPREAGVYAIFLPDVSVAPKDWQAGLRNEKNLLYIGKGESGLRTRLKRHFAGKHSTKDTFRRSAGAMLRTSLNLKPKYHPSKSSDSQYSFHQEELLSNWIKTHCTFTFCCMRPKHIKAKEKELIKKYTPPLNSSGNLWGVHPLLVNGARIECMKLAKSNLNMR